MVHGRGKKLGKKPLSQPYYPEIITIKGFGSTADTPVVVYIFIEYHYCIFLVMSQKMPYK